MNTRFDDFVKEHLQAILREAEKEQALAQIKIRQRKHTPQDPVTPHHHESPHDMHLHDCVHSPSFSQHHL